MIKNIINDRGGLHNRVTKLLYLYPFILAETEAYCKSKQINLSRYQILQLYMTLGGVPMYLDQLNPTLSAVQNIQEICFSPYGYLKKEFDRLYASLFDNYQQHIELIRALATKRKGLSRPEIIKLTKFQNGGHLSLLLEELAQSGFIDIYQGYGKKVKESLFRLTDSYSLFYLTPIEPLGPNGHQDFSRLSELPQWKSWSGYSFESICLSHVDQIKKALSIKGISSSTASFIAKDHLSGTQIELVIDRNDQSINICEMKFCKETYEITKKDLDKIQLKKKIFQYHTKTKKHLFSTLITTFGAADNSHAKDIDQIITMDALFES